MIKKWVPDELKKPHWMSCNVKDPTDFEAFLKPRSNSFKGIQMRDPRRWLLLRLTKKPEFISVLLSSAKTRFPGMTRKQFMALLKTLFSDKYLFCKLTHTLGQDKRPVRAYQLFIRGTKEDPWINCENCPAFAQCKIRKRNKNER